MSKIFHRSSIHCFYCNLQIEPRPSNPKWFQCPHCACWNRFDENGEPLSDEPAMHDEQLNMASFSKRASPNRNHLPTSYGSGIFCHTCQTNQTLLVNLLSNYLPPPEDPSYEPRLAALASYTTSLQARYPPVCYNCLPAVEEEIKKKDDMARALALGGALKFSKGKEKERKHAGQSALNIAKELSIWKVQGGLWIATLLVVLSINTLGSLGLLDRSIVRTLLPFLPLLVVASLACHFWDPTHSLVLRSRIQDRGVRVRGQSTYKALQVVPFLCRFATSILLTCSMDVSPWIFSRISSLCIESGDMIGTGKGQLWFTSCLSLEVLVLLLSYVAIDIRQPAPVRLIDTSSHLRSPTSPAFPEIVPPDPTNPLSTANGGPDLLATLSLSSNPTVSNYAVHAQSTHAINPIFGKPSLNVPSLSTSVGARQAGGAVAAGSVSAQDPDAMDWEPSSFAAQPNPVPSNNNEDDFFVKPQKFFPPEKPTGLETLLMRTRLVDDDTDSVQAAHARRRATRKGTFNWWMVYAFSALPISTLVFLLWDSRRR